MPLPAAYGDTVTVLTTTVSGQDPDGNDEFAVAENAVAGCVVYPRDGNGTLGNEQMQGQDLVIIGVSVLFPYGTAITSNDLIRVDGTLYNVDGVPGVWRHPMTGTRGGVQVAATRWTG
jgi:hypothetical protein